MFKRPLCASVRTYVWLFLSCTLLVFGAGPTAAQGTAQGEIVFTSDRDGGYGVYVMSADGTNLKEVVNDAVANGSTGYNTVKYSPDGQGIAFVTVRDGSPQIYLMNPDGSNQRRLTNDTNTDSLLWWTLDSKRIIYQSSNWGKSSVLSVYSMNADGSSPQLDKDRRIGQTSPDGKHIVYQAQNNITVSNPDGTGTRAIPFSNWVTDVEWSPDSKSLVVSVQNTEIDVIGIDGTGKKTLVSNVNTTVAWSPDGQNIAYAGIGDKGYGIYTVGIDGKNPVLLLEGGASGFDWSPDGKQLAFYSDRDRRSEIYSMAADGSNTQRLTDGNEKKSSPRLSPDGQHILFEKSGKDDGLYIMDRDGKNPTRLTNGYGNGLWSPDGKLIAFAGLSVMNADGTNQHQVTSTGNIPLAWTPDSQQIAFTASYSSTGQQVPGLFLVSANGTNEHELTSDTPAGAPAWSPDGKQIAYTSNKDSKLYVMDAKGKNKRLISSTTSYGPAWSSDGKQVAVVGLGLRVLDPSKPSVKDDRVGIDVYRVPSGPAHHGAFTGALVSSDDYLLWSADGKQIYYKSDAGGNWDIYVVNADGTNAKNLTNNPGDDENFSVWIPKQ